MQARKMIAGAAYGPQVLKALYEAFDGAWEQIQHRYGDDPALVGPARTRLAHAVLALATDNTADAEELKERVLDIVGR